MDAAHMNADLSRVAADELSLVGDLLRAMSPVEAGPYPGAQLSRARSGRVWTITDGSMTVDVRRSGSITGLEQPVWLTSRALWYAARTAGPTGWCSIGIDDCRHVDGSVAALIDNQFAHARIDLPAQPPLAGIRAPVPESVVATAITDMTALLYAVEAASLTPVGVPVSGPPAGVVRVDYNSLFIRGTDRRGVDSAAEFRLHADTERHLDPAVEFQVCVDLEPLIEVGEHLPLGEVIVTLTRDGEVWLIAGPCRVVCRGDARRLEPDEFDGVVYLVGRVEGTGEAVLSASGDCPVDGLIVWLDSQPDLYDRLERIEELHSIVWYAEPQPYGVSTGDE